MPIDAALRITALAAFLITGTLVWLLARRLRGTFAAHLSLGAFLFSPFALVWSRASMIEFLATAGAVGAVLFAWEWMDHRRPIHWVLATLAATVGMTVKVTTGAFWLMPIVGYRADRWRRGERPDVRADAPLVLLLALALAAAAAWTRYADAVKARDPQTTPQTSAALTAWTFGDMAQRLDPTNWLDLVMRIVGLVVGPFIALAIVGAFDGMRLRAPWSMVGLLAACVLPIVTFFNLYVVHDYYLAAVTPGLAILVGVGGARVWERTTGTRQRTLGLAAVSIVATLVASEWYWGPIYEPVWDPEQVIPQAHELAALSHPDDLVLVLGRDWSPAVLYYSRRRGLTLPDRFVAKASAEGWFDDTYTIASVARPETDPLAVLRHWRVVIPLGPRTYALRTEVTDEVGANVIALSQEPDGPTGRLLSGPRGLRCGLDTVTVRSAGGVWFRFAGTSAAARLHVTASAPLPLVAAIYVGERALDGGATTVGCSGDTAVALTGVFEGPPPAR